MESLLRKFILNGFAVLQLKVQTLCHCCNLQMIGTLSARKAFILFISALIRKASIVMNQTPGDSPPYYMIDFEHLHGVFLKFLLLSKNYE